MRPNPLKMGLDLRAQKPLYFRHKQTTRSVYLVLNADSNTALNPRGKNVIEPRVEESLYPALTEIYGLDKGPFHVKSMGVTTRSL